MVVLCNPGEDRDLAKIWENPGKNANDLLPASREPNFRVSFEGKLGVSKT